MRHRPNRIWIQLLIAASAVFGLSALGCGESGGIGACFSDQHASTGQRWCNDGFDEAECDSYNHTPDPNNPKVNGVNWTYHDDQTCEELGCPTGNC
jgi:hypothetical protein